MAKEFDFGDELRRRMAAQDASKQRQTQSSEAKRQAEHSAKLAQLHESIDELLSAEPYLSEDVERSMFLDRLNVQDQLEGANEILFNGDGYLSPVFGNTPVKTESYTTLVQDGISYGLASGGSPKHKNVTKYYYDNYQTNGYVLTSSSFFPHQESVVDSPSLADCLYVGFCERLTDKTIRLGRGDSLALSVFNFASKRQDGSLTPQAIVNDLFEQQYAKLKQPHQIKYGGVFSDGRYMPVRQPLMDKDSDYYDRKREFVTEGISTVLRRMR